MLVTLQISKALYWFCYYFVLRDMQDGQHFNALMIAATSFGASTVAGVFSTVLTNPLWVAVTHFQVSLRFRSLAEISPCSGVAMNVLLVCFPSLRQAFYESMLVLFARASRPSSNMLGLVGALATCLATVLTYPLQTWRTQQQAYLPVTLTFAACFSGVAWKVLSALIQCYFFSS
jgi:hypothetical protein